MENLQRRKNFYADSRRSDWRYQLMWYHVRTWLRHRSEKIDIKITAHPSKMLRLFL